MISCREVTIRRMASLSLSPHDHLELRMKADGLDLELAERAACVFFSAFFSIHHLSQCIRLLQSF